MHRIQKDNIPKALLELPEPPKKLYIIGTLPKEEQVYLTIVGSRKHTSYGRDACVRLIESLAGYPIVIVSGLAMGIDTIVHETALRVGLTTIAFPGSGLDPKVLYPRTNHRLAQKIVKQGGCLLSEFEPKTEAALWTFPKRNRLMAGISQATLIIEAEKESGTLITSRLATEYNRDVMALPGNIFSPTSSGTNMLLRLGATPITRSEDILEVLGFDIEDSVESHSKRLEALADCSDEEKKILAVLREALPRDELARILNKPVHEVNETLSILEIKGLLKEEYGEIRRV